MSLGYYYALLRKKENEVERLIQCRSSLQGTQQEFYDNEEKCLEPPLSLNTFHGQHASDFQEIRESGIHQSFLDIAGNQFSRVFEAIADKIAQLRAEIAEIKRIIAMLLSDD